MASWPRDLTVLAAASGPDKRVRILRARDIGRVVDIIHVVHSNNRLALTTEVEDAIVLLHFRLLSSKLVTRAIALIAVLRIFAISRAGSIASIKSSII